MRLMANRALIALAGWMAGTFPVSPVANGATIRDDQADADYLALAAQSAYGSVGSFVNSWGYTGSAVLIAPDWILTAAHNFTAAAGGTFTLGGISYTTTQIISNPGWHNGDVFGGSDFGLAHLSVSVPNVTPATLYTGSAEVGQVGTFVGYGLTGNGLTGYGTLDNQKRAFQNMIDGNFGNPSLVLGCDFDNPSNPADSGFGSAIPLTLEGCVAPGDSGGGVFITIGSETFLAGIISFIGSADGAQNADYGDVSGFGRASAYAPWILSTIPEPSSSAFIGAVGMCWFGRRIRRKILSGGKRSGYAGATAKAR